MSVALRIQLLSVVRAYMRHRIPPDIVQSYILPICLAIAILAVSGLINIVKITNLLAAAGLAAIVITGLFIGQYAAFKTLRLQERDALYGILSTISFSSSHHLPTSSVLSQGDVLGIESAAREVWVYAYDLNYERFDSGRSPFTNAVVTNLAKGVVYKYLIPNSPEIIRRAIRMDEYLSQYARSPRYLEFRVAENPPIFNQFSVTLYNPDVVRHDRPQGAEVRTQGDDRSDLVPVAVFYPHYKDFGTSSDSFSTPFIAVRNGGALEIQERFEAMLRDATHLHASQKAI